MRLENHTAVITGGASGIGAAAARLFAAEGARVAILDTAADPPCDVSDERSVCEAFGRITAGHGVIDSLFHCAGIAVRRPVWEENVADWDRCLAVNLRSAFLCSKYAIPHMRRGASILHMASVTGSTGVRNRAAYSASKGAIIALTRNMALDLAPRGIRVNCLCPGFVRTPLLTPLLRDPDRTARLTALHPLGRLGEPEDVAQAALFLVSDESSWITGQALGVDGGFAAGQAADI